MNTSSSSTGGIGLFGMLGVLFVGLKLTNFIDWSWWWVTAPFWMPAVVLLGFAFIAFIIYLVSTK